MANTTASLPDNWPNWAVTGDRPRPTDAFIAEGWPYSATPPTRQQFNWAMSEAFNGVRYMVQRGAPDWSATETYATNARVQRGGLTYKALAGTINQDPATTPAVWERWGYSLSEINTIMAAAIAGYVTPAQLTTAVNNAVVAATKITAPQVITGLFGAGKSQMFTVSGTFIVPAGITSIRARVGGCGRDGTTTVAGGGGGWGIRTITVTPGQSIIVTITAQGTTSFGAFISVAAPVGGAGGISTSGDINYVGGNTINAPALANGGGGGAANAWGPGGISAFSGKSGGGGTSTATSPNGGNGVYGAGALSGQNAVSNYTDMTLDVLGAGPGGGQGGHGVNGGGGGSATGRAGDGGFPGGGGGISGAASTVGLGGPGYVAVEW